MPGGSLTNEVRVGGNLPAIDFQNSLRQTIPFVLTGLPGWNPTTGTQTDPQGRDDRAYNYQDNLSVTRGRHSLRAGFSAQLYRLASYGNNLGPAYSFQAPVYNVADIASGTIDNVTQTYALTGGALRYSVATMPRSRLSSNLISEYFQDDWKISPLVTLNLGVRYDYLSPVREQTGTALLPVIGTDPYASLYQTNLKFAFAKDGLYKADRNNFSPYAGLAWKLGRNLPLVFRGAYSISYVNDDLLRNMSTFSIGGPWQGITFDRSLAGTRLNDAPLVGNVDSFLPSSPDLSSLLLNNFHAYPGVPDPQLKTPYVQQWNAGLEGEVKGWLISGRYIGNRLTKGLRSIDANQVVVPDAYLQAFRTAATALATFDPAHPVFPSFPRLLGGGVPASASGAATVYSLLAQGQAGQLAQFHQFFGYNGNGAYPLFANPAFANPLLLLANLGRSRYDSLQISASRRLSNRITVLANYTFGRVLSNLNDYSQGAIDPYLDIKNQGLDRSRAPIDLRHAIKARWIYTLPFGKGQKYNMGRLAPVLGGWSISGVVIVQSGAPFSLLSGRGTLSTSFASAKRNTLASTLSEGQIDQRLNFTLDGLGPRYFTSTPSEFRHPDAGSVGSVPLRAFDGPWQETINIGLHKRFAIRESSAVEIRGEAFNLANHVNWVIPDQTLGVNAGALSGVANAPYEFGRTAFQSNSPRRVQFTLRLTF